MYRIFRKEQVLTIPNLLSFFRILLIPLIIYLDCGLKRYHLTALVILLSGATDIIDGFIARRFHMTSDLGKILDPVADKLTQGAVMICLMLRYRAVIVLAAVFLLCEAIKFLLGLWSLDRHDSVNSARWYGKVNTVLIFFALLALIVFPEISVRAVNIITAALCCSSLCCIVLYISFYMKLFAASSAGKQAESEDAGNS